MSRAGWFALVLAWVVSVASGGIAPLAGVATLGGVAPSAGVVPPQGVGANAERNHGAHSWLVVQETGGGWRLAHLPPRGFGRGAASAGQVRPAVNLESPPIALAASAARVYLIYQDAPAMGPEEDGRAKPRVRVYSLRAVPVMGAVWTFDPSGRFDSHPFPSTDRPVAGAATDSLGRLALLLEGDGEPAELLLLENEAWTLLPIGSALPDAGVLGFGFGMHGLSVLIGGDSPAVWTQREDSSFVRTQTLDPEALAGLISVRFFGDRVVWATRAGDTLEVWSARGGQSHRVASITGMSGELSIAPIRVGGGRLGILEKQSDEAGTAQFRFVELSLATGEVLFDGPPAQDSPVTPGEFRMLAVSLVLFMVVVLVLTFRPRMDPSAIVVPKGTALAAPGRRLVASGVDFLLAAMLVSTVYGVSLNSLVTGLVLIEPGDGWMALPATLLVGAVAGTVCESFFAWTPGKLVTGCRVIRLGPEPRRLTLIRSAQRNVIKWLTPPIAAMAMLDPQTRHRGDDLARAVVVVRAAPPPEPPSEPPAEKP